MAQPYEANQSPVAQLPPGFQTQIDEQNQQRQLAQVLMQMAMGQQGNQQGQMISGHYVAPGFLQQLAPALMAFAGRRQDTQAQEAIRGVRQKAGEARQAEMAGVNPEDATTLTKGMSSQFPDVAKHSDALYQALMKRRGEWFGQAAPVSTPESILKSGGDPTKLSPVGPWQQTQYETTDALGQKQTMPMFRGDRGQPPVFPPGAATNINLGPKFAEEQAGKNYDALRTARPSVVAASQALPQLAQAYDLLQNAPLNLGAGASTQTSIQAMSKWLGIPVPENVPASQFLSETLLPAFTADLKKVAPTGSTSDRELSVAQQLAVNAQKDPRMLNAAIAQAARAHKAIIDDYNQQLDAAHQFAMESKLPPNRALLPAQFRISGMQEPSENTIRDLFGTPVQELLKRMPPAQVSPSTPQSRRNLPSSVSEEELKAEYARRGLPWPGQ
jgi:hypothetical protein